MSIGKAQAQALASGFLNNLGTDDKSGLIPRESLSELFLLAGEFIEDAQSNLNETNSNASGSLSRSLVIENPKQTGTAISVDIMMSKYGEFINKGVRGTKSGSSKAGYSFKSPFPSRAMVEALRASIGRAKRSTTNVNRLKSTSKNEIKNVKISDISKAYGAGRNIKMYGIKANSFIDKAFTATESKAADRFGAAFKIDIINSLPSKI